MKNNPADVTSLLVEMMERLSSDELCDDKLVQEIDRSKAIADVSKNVLSIWNLQLRVAEAKDAALRPESFELPSALKL